jgi:hypothetical protein
MEEEIKNIKMEINKKNELDEKLKKITEEKNKDDAVLANLKKEVELKKNEMLKKDEENKRLLEEKKKLAEEYAKKEAFIQEQQKKEKEITNKNKEVISKLEKEKKEKEEAFQKLKKVEEEKKVIEEQSKLEIAKLEKDIQLKQEEEKKNKELKEQELLKEKKALEKKFKEEEKAALERHNKVEEKINIDFDKNELIKNFITKSKTEEKIWNKAGKINSLSDEDQKFALNEMKNVINNDKDKIEVYEKLSQYMDIIKKIKNLKNNFEIKKSNLIQFDDCKINPEKLKEKLEIYLQILNKENIKKEDINKIVNEIINFDEEKQEYFIKNFREKITTNNKEFIMKQIEQILNKKKIQKKFAYKVLEKYIKNVIIEQEKNEKKYGIYINNEDKNETLLIKKLKELNKDKYNELKNYIIEDLNRINEISEKEKELEEIIDVINSLNIDDKLKILEEIKNNKLFDKIIEILEKREKKYNEEKKERKKVAFKEIEEKRKNDENNLLYSLVNSITEKNDSLDLESNDNKENIKHKFTIFKGNLETVEIY